MNLIGVDCIALLLLVPSTDISVNLIGVDCIALLLVVPSTDISVNLIGVPTNPVGVAALLDVWGEKLGGPRAGV